MDCSTLRRWGKESMVRICICILCAGRLGEPVGRKLHASRSRLDGWCRLRLTSLTATSTQILSRLTRLSGWPSVTQPGRRAAAAPPPAPCPRPHTAPTRWAPSTRAPGPWRRGTAAKAPARRGPSWAHSKSTDEMHAGMHRSMDYLPSIHTGTALDASTALVTTPTGTRV